MNIQEIKRIDLYTYLSLFTLEELKELLNINKLGFLASYLEAITIDIEEALAINKIPSAFYAEIGTIKYALITLNFNAKAGSMLEEVLEGTIDYMYNSNNTFIFTKEFKVYDTLEEVEAEINKRRC